jgi:hypothetical protein
MTIKNDAPIAGYSKVRVGGGVKFEPRCPTQFVSKLSVYDTATLRAGAFRRVKTAQSRENRVSVGATLPLIAAGPSASAHSARPVGAPHDRNQQAFQAISIVIKFPYFTIIGLSLRKAFIVFRSRFKWACTSSGGVNAIHWLRETSIKRGLRNISRYRNGSSPRFST